MTQRLRDVLKTSRNTSIFVIFAFFNQIRSSILIGLVLPFMLVLDWEKIAFDWFGWSSSAHMVAE